jgi:ferric-dicitrate binding protein FerR (iron transport regulator)
MTDDFDWQSLARYLSGACTPAESRAMERWVAERPDRQRELDMLRAAWERAGDLQVEPRSKAALQRVMARIGIDPVAFQGSAEERVSHVPRLTLTPSPLAKRWSSVAVAGRAAAVLLVALVTGFAWMYSGRARGRAAPDQPMREYATQPAQRADVRLADGTLITLGPTTRMRVPADYGRRTRTVHLEGEAYFVVEHDERRPFLVHTGGAVAEDLGTAFVVRAYPSEGMTEVVVAEGKVELRASETGSEKKARGVALSPGQLGRLDRSGLITVETDVDVESRLAWTSGRLSFRKSPLADVAREIERWYDVRLEWGDSTLGAVPVSVSFDNQSVDEMIRTLAQLLDVRYTRSGSTVRLRTGGASR